MKKHRILLLGLMGRFPMAGIGWQVLHHLIGLERLGCEVFYVEDSGAPAYDPRAVSLAEDVAPNVEFVRRVMARTAHPQNWVYWDAGADEYHGLGREPLRELYATAGQIWNLCGATRLREEHRAAGVRVYVQTDPGFEEIAMAAGDAPIAAQIDAHDVLFTYGANVPLGTSTVPTGGRVWRATRPPVLLDAWDAPPMAVDAPFSTIGTWRNEGKDVCAGGRTHRWSKDAAFGRVRDVPRAAGVRVRAAIAPPAVEVVRMEQAGWEIVEPEPISGDLDAYRSFLHDSRGEFTVAKDVYVDTRSGWFSDRSACYLASARPVVTQDTGFGDTVPTGLGLHAFATPREAAQALRAIAADPGANARAARSIAEEFFDAERLLASMLEEIDLSRR